MTIPFVKVSMPDDALYVVGKLLESSLHHNDDNEACTLIRDHDQKHFVLPSNDFEVSCPSLSLMHPESHAAADPGVSRKDAESHAAKLLARPLPLMGPACCFPELGQKLLQNFYQSFCILIDSRLRASALYLAKHGISLARKDAKDMIKVEAKLERLLRLGNEIVADSVQSKFLMADAIYELEEGRSLQLPVQFEVAMKLVIPLPHGGVKMITSTFTAPGDITGVLEQNAFVGIHIKMNEQRLLGSMMKQASRVVAAVAEIATSGYEVANCGLQRDDSFLAMPPPLPKQPRCNLPSFLGLNLLSKTATELPIVSPDMSAMFSPTRTIPDLELEEDLSDLSVDQCAIIVDGVFGEFDDAIFRPSPAKKARTTC